MSKAQAPKAVYDTRAKSYTFLSSIREAIGMGRLRRRLLAEAKGKVLEVAAGSGQNLPYYPSGVSITLADLSETMLGIAKTRASKNQQKITTFVADTEKLPFPDDSFETVVSALSLCTYDNPIRALREMARVCQPSGKILLLEHGQSSWLLIRLWQNFRERHFRNALHCHGNRDPIGLCQNSGLTITKLQRTLFGIMYLITAAKEKPA